jgi:hypothetical protein
MNDHELLKEFIRVEKAHNEVQDLVFARTCWFDSSPGHHITTPKRHSLQLRPLRAVLFPVSLPHQLGPAWCSSCLVITR